MHQIRQQFVTDMQAAGLTKTAQERYLGNVDRLFQSVWCSPEEVTEAMVKEFMIGKREQDVARETFRNYFFALKLFFVGTMKRDWDTLKKTPFVPRPGSACARR